MNKGKEVGLSSEVANWDFHQDGLDLPVSNYLEFNYYLLPTHMNVH